MTLDPGEVRIDGYKLGDGTTRVHLVGPIPTNRSHRLNTQAVARGTDKQSWGGRGLPELGFELVIQGPPAGVAQEAKFALNILDDEDRVVTIEASGQAWRGHSRLPVRTNQLNETQLLNKDKARLTIELSVIVQGVWKSNNGDYAEPLAVWFKKTASGWERYDGETFTDAEGPLLELPAQHTGYPLFTKESDLSQEQLAVTSTRLESDDGEIREHETFDLTGFLHPEPTSTGDIGHAYGLQVPDTTYLGFRHSAGLGTRKVGTMMVGTG